MTKKNFLSYIALLLPIVIFLSFRNKPIEEKVCFKDYCFLVELAKTQEEKAQGLMFRESLDPDRGMFFIFENEAEYSFWMKDVLIPLDIIWINKDKEVVFIKKNAQPCVMKECEIIKSGKKAKYILETGAGITDKINLKMGDGLAFDI